MRNEKPSQVEEPSENVQFSVRQGDTNNSNATLANLIKQATAVLQSTSDDDVERRRPEGDDAKLTIVQSDDDDDDLDELNDMFF